MQSKEIVGKIYVMVCILLSLSRLADGMADSTRPFIERQVLKELSAALYDISKFQEFTHFTPLVSKLAASCCSHMTYHDFFPSSWNLGGHTLRIMHPAQGLPVWHLCSTPKADWWLLPLVVSGPPAPGTIRCSVTEYILHLYEIWSTVFKTFANYANLC